MSGDILRSSYDIIYEELTTKVQGPTGMTADSFQIVCPFHDDTDPSLGIYLGIGMEIPLGYFHCFGCHAKGHWNVLADKLNLKKISGVNGKIKTVHEVGSKLSKLHSKLEVVNGVTSLDRLMQTMGKPSYYPWSADTEWRGYPGHLIRACEGQFLMEAHHKHNELVCFFPIKIGKRYYGGVRAYLRKRKGKLSFVNTGGSWAQDYGLFPYNYVHDMIRRYKLEYVILVEGPRDALRLLMMGVPALSILGSKQFTREKIRLLVKLGIKHIFTMPDNDTGGDKFKGLVKEQLELFNARSPKEIMYNNFRFPKPKDKKGKIIKIDPDNAEPDLLDDFLDSIEDMHYGFAPELEY
jgi:5S rRNA maturation endonuclease (ribonuclease M5)